MRTLLMAAKFSTRVTGWQKLGRFLGKALLGSQGQRVAGKMLDRIRPLLQEGDSLPDFFATFRGLTVNLKDGLVRLIMADDLLYDANARLTALRDRRENLYKRLTALVTALRGSLQSQFVAPRFDHLGFGDRTARTIDLLLRQARRIGKTFQADNLDEILGEANFENVYDPRPSANELILVADELSETMEDVDETVRDRDELQIDRNQTLDEVYGIYNHTARGFESCCRLVGEGEIANRVRPPVGRVSRSSGEDDPASEDGRPAATEEAVIESTVTSPQVGEDVDDAIVSPTPEAELAPVV